MSKEIAEEATGVKENPSGLGRLYLPGGIEVSAEQASKVIFEGKSDIAVPNAGAGSYRKVFELLGFEKVENIETSSSAGDWTFAVCRDGFWYPAWQTNRYPHFGYAYSVDASIPSDSVEELTKLMFGP